MATNRKTSSKSPKAPKLPYPFPRPALMQTWGELQELQDLRKALMREYGADSTVVKILVHELALYTWEIHELMKVKHAFTRRQYLDRITSLANDQKLTIDGAISNAFIKREAAASKLLDGMIEDLPVDAGELIVTAISRYKRQFEAIDAMLNAAERRRSQLLKELDRYEMARLLIAERKGR